MSSYKSSPHNRAYSIRSTLPLPDLGQIGGNIATNAGGNKVRCGLYTRLGRGLKVVTGKGDILELNNGLVNHNVMICVTSLLVQKDAGFITEATIHLMRPPKHLAVC